MLFRSGPTKGQVNPDLRVEENAVVQINIVNGDGAQHDFAIPDYDVKSDQIGGKGAATAIVFRANRAGIFEYLCSLPGHKAAGMVGRVIVGDPQEAAGSRSEERRVGKECRSRWAVEQYKKNM